MRPPMNITARGARIVAPRIWVLGGALLCAGALYGGAAAAAGGSLMAVMSGAGEVTVNGARLAARELYYFYFAENGRTSFSVHTDAGAIGFSGEVDVFPAPGPGTNTPYATQLSSFFGTNPNGDWKLFVADDHGLNSGRFSGWTLDFGHAELRSRPLPRKP